MKDSEFIASCDLTLHTKDGEPCASIEGAKEIKIPKGKSIPEPFIPLFLRNNHDYLANLKKESGIPVLTPSQEKKYGIVFRRVVQPTFKEAIEKEYDKWDMERLTQKLAELKAKKFKEWAEEEFGTDKIDKRKSADNIIVDILELQEA